MTDPRASRIGPPGPLPSPRKLAAALAVTLVAGLTLAPRLAEAAPAVSAGGSFGTQGAQGSAKGKKGGFKLPERVAQGNAISLLMPVQLGFVGYIPRVRIGFQYDRQILKAHWVYAGAAVLLDRGDYNSFKLDACGLNTVGSCNPGTVAGFDIYAGYAHKWYLRDNPYLVPIARGAIGGGAWWYPDIGGSRQQDRMSSWSLSVRPGGGLRLFLVEDVALGFDVNFILGFMSSKDKPASAPVEKKTNFLFGMEILPLIVEYRF